MSAPLKGGCGCGAVRYEIAAEPQFSCHCQCRQCQRATGGGHSSLFIVAADAARVTGEPTLYERSSEGGSTVTQAFCPTCGSPLFGRSTGYPGIMMFHAASLDDPSLFKPEKIVWPSGAQPWDVVDENLPKGD